MKKSRKRTAVQAVAREIGIVVKRTTSRRPGRVDYEENVQDFEMKSSTIDTLIILIQTFMTIRRL
uniref:Uncharacterized protein n=1 Tax=Pristionchus pacificus TaxID=54126 RepID=A0A2A6B7L5_PRIPA|eukprot:PDM61866.1 hypothetical protein PRIPAC_51308 [Pristionchus pacificus]